MPKFVVTHVEHLDDAGDPNGFNALVYLHLPNGDVEAKARYRSAGLKRLEPGDTIVAEGQFKISLDCQPELMIFVYEKYTFNGDIDENDIIGPLLRNSMCVCAGERVCVYVCVCVCACALLAPCLRPQLLFHVGFEMTTFIKLIPSPNPNQRPSCWSSCRCKQLLKSMTTTTSCTPSRPCTSSTTQPPGRRSRCTSPASSPPTTRSCSP
jgi:hypothetical protein